MLSSKVNSLSLYSLVAMLIIGPPAVWADCGGEPPVSSAASWQAYVRWCSCMKGTVASSFSAAQREGGCRLPSGSGLTSGGDSIGTALGTAIGKELGKALFGDPEEKARQESAARELALSQQRAAAAAAAEAERKKQEDFARLRGVLKLDNFDGDRGDLLLKGVDVEPGDGLVLKLGDSGSDPALQGNNNNPDTSAPNTDPMVVDARNVPSGLPQGLEQAIAAAYPDVPPGVNARVRKGFQAVTNRDWKVANAWFQDALLLDPGNLGLRRLVALTETTPPSKPQPADKSFTREPIPPGSDKHTYAETSTEAHSHEALMKFLFPTPEPTQTNVRPAVTDLQLPDFDEDEILLFTDPAAWRKKHPDWWKDVPEMVERRNRPIITATSPDGKQVLLPHPSDPDLLFNLTPTPVAPTAVPGESLRPHN